jgi:cholesterol transport system auxiliary component
MVWLALMLGGCVSVFPKEKPVQLYRFGASAGPPISAPPAAARVSVRFLPLTFVRASAGDRILTVDGDTAAYIKGARWLSPASILFEAAIHNAFDRAPIAPRLMARNEISRPDYLLQVDVRAFEARYLEGETQPPTIFISMTASLARPGGKTATAVKSFETRFRARENREGAIADAFDRAVETATGELAAWTDANSGG